MTLDQAKELIGKRVCVNNICGVLQFVGPNEFLGWELQVTVNRMPIKINSLEEIKIQKI